MIRVLNVSETAVEMLLLAAAFVCTSKNTERRINVGGKKI